VSLQKDLIEETLNLLKYIDCNTSNSNLPSLLQLRTLSYIKKEKKVKTTDLSKELNVTPATVTAQIDRLVKGKWVERYNCEKDRRVIYLCLTKKANKQLDAMVGNTFKKITWLFDDLTKAEQNQLLNLIKKMKKTAEREQLKNE
jgi:DNA-binding MarR family transcriptional regulator